MDLTKEIVDEVIRRLDIAEIICHKSWVGLGGLGHWGFTPNELKRILMLDEDGEGINAFIIGCSKQEYVNWSNWGGIGHCSGLTKAGKPCRLNVPYSEDFNTNPYYYINFVRKYGKEPQYFCDRHSDQRFEDEDLRNLSNRNILFRRKREA